MSILQITDGSGRLLDAATLILFGTMLYPKDEEKRELFIARSCADVLVEREHVPLEPLRDLLGKALKYPGPDPSEDFERFRSKGDIAGKILLFILNCAGSGASQHASVKKAVFVLAEENKFGSRATINSAWSDYKSVSHLWAALDLWQHDFGMKNYYAPDTPEGLVCFLSMAETFRQMAETHFPPGKHVKRPIPTFDQNEAWRVPSDLCMPPFEVIAWPPLTKWCIETLKNYTSEYSKQ